MKKKRLKSEVRKAEILAAAITVAEAKGYSHLTRDDIAQAAGITGPGMLYHFKTMTQFRGALMRYAVKQKHLRVIAQGLVLRDSHACRADDDLQKQAWDSLK